jgi:hypothetical protein
MKKIIPVFILLATCSSRRTVWLDIANGDENMAQLVDDEPHPF